MTKIVKTILLMFVMAMAATAQTNLGPIKIGGGATISNSSNVAQTANANSWPAAQEMQTLNLKQFASPSTTGADLCAKIATAIGRLPSTGGTVDARGLQGAQTCSTDPLAGVTKPVEIMLSGVTITSSARWSLRNGLTISAPGRSKTGATSSVVFVPTGAIWMFASADTTQVVSNVRLNNVTVNLAANNSAIGGIDFSGVGVSHIDNPNVILPNGGNGVIGIKLADPSNVYGYFNTVINPYIYCANRANNHVGFWMTSIGNDHKIFGGATEGVGQPVKIDNNGGGGGGNGNAFFGTGFEGFQAHAILLGNGAQANSFFADRAENTSLVPTSLVRSGGTVTATFTNGHFLSSNIAWSSVGGGVSIAGSTAVTNTFDGTFTPTIVDANTLTWTQAGANETATGVGLFNHGDIFWAASTSARSHIIYPNPLGLIPRLFLDQAADTDYAIADPAGNSAAHSTIPYTFDGVFTNRPTQNTVSSFTQTFGNSSSTAATFGTLINMGCSDSACLGLNVQFAGAPSFRIYADHWVSSGTANSTYAGPIMPSTAGGTTLGIRALPWSNIYLGAAGTNNIQLTGTGTAARTQTFQDASGTVPLVIASGTSTLTTTAVGAGACQTTVTTGATNALATDTISWAFASAPTAATDGVLHILPYVTANNVNFMRCNASAGSITPTALVINWRVIR